MAIYQKLIAENLGKTDLIILPESALPTLENAITPFFEKLEHAAKETKTEIMIGTVFQDTKSGKLLNPIMTTETQIFLINQIRQIVIINIISCLSGICSARKYFATA